MGLNNNLKKQVDIPVWEWCRFAPTASSTVSSTCMADNSLYHVTFGRYIYFMNSAPAAQSATVGYIAGFFRYDTITDTYQMLSFPLLPIASYTAMQFAGGQGYNARVISAGLGNNTIQAAAFTGKTLKGFDIRISGGTGAGQHRVITDVSDPVIAYAGTVTTATASPDDRVIDANANWAINQWAGYQVRYFHSSGQAQTRKIIYNTTNTLYFADIAKFAEDQWTWSPVYTLTGSPLTANAIGTPYQIESSIITVDNPWITPPDETSRFVVRSGGIWLVTNVTTISSYVIQYYDIAADQWYVRNACLLLGPVVAVGTEATIVNSGENATVFERGTALGAQSVTNLQDTTKSWTVNQWAGYSLRIYSGTGDGKIMNITSNTKDSLTFWPVLSLTPATVTTLAGASGSYIVTLATTTPAPIDCNGQSITGTNIGAGAKIVSGQGTTTLILSVANSDVVSGPLIIGTSATGNKDEFTITTSLPTPQTCNGWTISGTNIASGAKIVSGQGTTKLVLDLANTVGSVSGIITMAYKVTAATGAVGTYVITTNDLMPNNCNGWTIAGTGIGIGATIVSGQGTNSLVLSLPNTASVVGSVLTLTLIPDNTSHYFIDAFEMGIVSYVNPPAPKAATTVTATAGAYNSTSITLSANSPSNCNGWYIAGTGITPGTTTIVSGQGTKNLVLSATNLSGGVSGILIISPSIVTLAITTGSLINTNVVTLTTTSAPANSNGWYVAGAGVGLGATIVSGQGGLTLTLSMFNTATMTSGNLYLYPTIPVPTVSTLTYTGGSGTTITTSPTTILTPVNCNGWYVTGANIAVGTIVVSGQGTNSLVLSLSAGAINGQVTLSPTIATATAAFGAVGTYIVTTNAGEPITPANCNGWYISGTGIALGATIVSGQGTKSLTLSLANTATVTAGVVLTLSATAVSTGSISGAVFTAGATTGALTRSAKPYLQAASGGSFTFKASVVWSQSTFRCEPRSSTLRMVRSSSCQKDRAREWMRFRLAGRQG